MKKVVVVIAITFVVCTSCIYKFAAIRGNGSLVTCELSVSKFDRIKCVGYPAVRFFESDEYRVVYTVDSNLEEWVDIYTKNNELHIGTKDKFGNKSLFFSKYLVDVYCPALKSVTISGSGSFETVDDISVSSFDTKISGSGKIVGTVFCNDFSSKISGSGKITVLGASNDADISISGSGRFTGNEFEIKKANITISGSGKANVFVTDFMKVKISGSGNITYSGEPKIESKVTGSGKIKKN